MAVKDEIREQQKKLRGKGIKAKFEYFWEYYKWQTIASIIGLIFVTILIRDIILNQRDTFVYGVFINSDYAFDTETLVPDFAQYTNINIEETPITLESNLSYSNNPSDTLAIYTPSKIMALSESSDGDFMISDMDAMKYFSSNGYFIDIREVLSEEQIEHYQDNFYYYDYEEEGSIPVGIKVTNSPLISKTNGYSADAYFSVFFTSEKKQNAVKFLEFMYADIQFN